jgi:hypothetical protein
MRIYLVFYKIVLADAKVVKDIELKDNEYEVKEIRNL